MHFTYHIANVMFFSARDGKLMSQPICHFSQSNLLEGEDNSGVLSVEEKLCPLMRDSHLLHIGIPERAYQ